jgi:hypothetical protein
MAPGAKPGTAAALEPRRLTPLGREPALPVGLLPGEGLPTLFGVRPRPVEQFLAEL